jgi:hypothetical protein
MGALGGIGIVFAILAALGLWLFVWEPLGLPGSIAWRSARLSQRWRERLAATSTDDLARSASELIRYERWERFPSAVAVLERSSGWSDSSLREALRALFAECAEEDRERGRGGRDSNYFELYDCGLAAILEELDRRAG